VITNHKGKVVTKFTTSADTQNTTPPDSLQRINHLQVVLERLYEDLERQQKSQNQHFEKLKSETAQALDEVRVHLKFLLQIDTTETPLSFVLPITDEKLRKAWQVLFRYPDGATAETIAGELNRHRTTVSTYLNMLVTLEYAEKFRQGHEIFYKAIIKTEKEENIR